MKTQLKKGFTLVEIMIVVVIIGLLAALAIPAFKKVRNNAVEKSLINDARQVSSAVQQICSENATTSCTVGAASKFLNGNKLSSGVVIGQAKGSYTASGADLNADTKVLSIEAATGDTYFYLGHAQYDKSLTSNANITASDAGVTTGTVIKFDTVTGQPAI